MTEIETHHKETEPSDDLAEHFLLYIGPINATAIHKTDAHGTRRALDQHSVTFNHAEHPDIEIWEQGTLKVYCPAILPAFDEGKALKRLNMVLEKAEPFLYEDMPFLQAVQKVSESDLDFVSARLDNYVKMNASSLNLAKRALGENFRAYDRSIKLQKMFMEENQRENVEDADIHTQAIITFARQKAIFIAMAQHYAVEAVFDDQFADFPYHLPDSINNLITQYAPYAHGYGFDRAAYERGLYNYNMGAPNPDGYRFDPVIASLIAPYVLREDGNFDHYEGWDDFTTRVIEKVDDPVIRSTFAMFAKSMNIPLEYAFFAAYKMCQKEVRKRGKRHLYDESSAKMRACQIQESFERDLEYFQAIDPYFRLEYYESTEGGIGRRPDNYGEGSRLLTKEEFLRYRQALIQRAAIEYVNSVIGTYKFVPWEKSDLNFTGTLLPYSVMKSEKARIVRVLCDPKFSPFWKPKGYWFRDILPQLIASHPSMYSKWFLPLLEKDMIDPSIIKEADLRSSEYLKQLLVWEQNSTLRDNRPHSHACPSKISTEEVK